MLFKIYAKIYTSIYVLNIYTLKYKYNIQAEVDRTNIKQKIIFLLQMIFIFVSIRTIFKENNVFVKH